MCAAFIIIIIGYRIKNKRITEKKDTDYSEYQITWENEELTGSYDGELSKAKPSGEGVFVSEDGKFSYEGQWEKGEFNGLGKITYADGSWEEGEYEQGRRNGICRVYSSDADYTESRYHEGVPYGEISIYEDNTKKSSDYCINSILLSDLKEKAQLLSSKSLQNALRENQYIYVTGTVAFVAEDDENCYFRIDTESIGMVTGSYQNCLGIREKQAYMPLMKTGDQVLIYGYCIGSQKNQCIEDAEGYGYDYCCIQPVYGENLSERLKGMDADSYAFQKSYPYANYGESVEDTFIVLKSVRKGKKYNIQAKQSDAVSDKEQYTLIYQGDTDRIFYSGQKLQISGYYDGQYKRLQTNELNIRHVQMEQDDKKNTVYTYLYDMYPAINVMEIQ